MFKSLSAILHVGCRFCGGLNGIEVAINNWAYSTDYKYHPNCLTQVLNYPERYGNHLVDIALEIEQCIEENKISMEKRNERVKEALKKARERGNA